MNLTKIFQMRFSALLCVLLLTIPLSSMASPRKTLPLNGRWRFAMDDHRVGVKQHWFENFNYVHSIPLPGTTDEAGYGKEAPVPSMVNQSTFGWRRPAFFEGLGWYERDVMIPESWRGKRIELFLEQTRCRTQVWVDGKLSQGKDDSFATSHHHDLSKELTPGFHKITMLLDNTLDNYIGGSYIRSVMGQGNWHGVVGRIELRAFEPVSIDYVRFDAKDCKEGEVKIFVKNITKQQQEVTGNVLFIDEDKQLVKVPFEKNISQSSDDITVPVKLSKLERWSQFSPKLYNLRIELTSNNHTDVYEEMTGIRTVGKNKDHYITINDVPTFLRGSVNYNIFAMTGYPSTSVADWLEVFKIYQQWGMNHVRFHSLTPPEAAFIAADQLGIYLHCECPRAGVIRDIDSQNSFHISEGQRILRDYGNHPSFIMMSMGNELIGSLSHLSNILEQVSQNDKRRLFTAATGSVRDRRYHDDYKVCATMVRGFKGPQTDWDYKLVVDTMNSTIISHEVGQWFIYPDLSLIPKYNGVMKADNLEMIKNDLKQRGMLDLAPHFSHISGLFSSQLYKEEFEAIMRTPGLAGFQMHNLHDFPSQGTATCGMLDVFNGEKDFIKPEQFREFVAPVVPLIRMPRRVYTKDERFEAEIDLANFTQGVVGNGVLNWVIKDDSQVYYQGQLKGNKFTSGRVYKVGDISTSLSKIKEATKLELVVSVEGTEYRNRWNIWVYPSKDIKPIPQDVHVTSTWSDTKKALAKGQKVLFFPTTNEVAQWRPGQFKDVFWCPVWLKRGPETMSVWADTQHPALASFPTDCQTDWQWFGPLENSFAMSIEKLPVKFKPIVRVIDSFRKNQRLANLFEAKVGHGKLVVCSINLLNNLDDDYARINMRNSLIDYMHSNQFDPQEQLTENQLEILFKKVVRSQEKEFSEMKKVVFRQKAGQQPIIHEDGYSMKVNAKVSKSEDIVAWADKRDILVTFNCPKSQSGIVYLFMRNTVADQWGHLKTPQEAAAMDWIDETMVEYGNKINRPVSSLLIGHEFGEYIETISNFGSQGKWFALPVNAEQMHDGVLELSISTLNLPNVLVEFAFLPSKE